MLFSVVVQGLTLVFAIDVCSSRVDGMHSQLCVVTSIKALIKFWRLLRMKATKATIRFWVITSR